MVYKDGDTANLAYTFTKSRTFQEPNGLYQELYEPYALEISYPLMEFIAKVLILSRLQKWL